MPSFVEGYIQQGFQAGFQEGLAESYEIGRTQMLQEIIERNFRLLCGEDVSDEAREQIWQLPRTALKCLVVDALDFSSQADLLAWLEAHAGAA